MPRLRENPRILKLDNDAEAKLAKADKKLARLMKQVGPFQLEVSEMQSPFEALAESIVYQQLSGKAAATIFARLKALVSQNGKIKPEDILAQTEATLRQVGLSRAKALSIIDLSEKTSAGLIPDLKAMHSMSDEELVTALTSVRGIGKWTVEMLLIFRLGRLDVMPAADYGVRKGFALTYGLDDLPTVKELALHGEKWRPFRTIGSWYMWRALELEKRSQT